MKRILKILTVASAIAFCFFVVIWPVSYEMNLSRSLATGKYEPSDSIPLPAQYHLGFEEGGMWFFSHPTPYRGSIIGMTSANDPPPYRWFWHIGFLVLATRFTMATNTGQKGHAIFPVFISADFGGLMTIHPIRPCG